MLKEIGMFVRGILDRDFLSKLHQLKCGQWVILRKMFLELWWVTVWRNSSKPWNTWFQWRAFIYSLKTGLLELLIWIIIQFPLNTWSILKQELAENQVSNFLLRRLISISKAGMMFLLQFNHSVYFAFGEYLSAHGCIFLWRQLVHFRMSPGLNMNTCFLWLITHVDLLPLLKFGFVSEQILFKSMIHRELQRTFEI